MAALHPTASLLEGGCDPVAAELHLWASSAFDELTANCALSVLSYAERATGGQVLPSPHQLGREAMAGLQASDEDFLQYCAWALGQLGCRPTDTPRRGDVGLLRDPLPALTGALCLGDGRWAARLQRGAIALKATAVHAWGMPCPR